MEVERDEWKRAGADTDEEKEQIYGTEIAGHSVNLALCSYSRRRIKGRRWGRKTAFVCRVSYWFCLVGAFQLRNPAKSSDNSRRVFVHPLYLLCHCGVPFPLTPPSHPLPLGLPPSLSLSRLLLPCCRNSEIKEAHLLFVRHRVNTGSWKNRRQELPDCRDSVLGYSCSVLHSRIAINW